MLLDTVQSGIALISVPPSLLLKKETFPLRYAKPKFIDGLFKT